MWLIDHSDFEAEAKWEMPLAILQQHNCKFYPVYGSVDLMLQDELLIEPARTLSYDWF